MCGGFTLYDPVDFEERFKVMLPKEMNLPRYNIRPSMKAIAIKQAEGKRIVQDMRFGMIPVWAKDMKIGYKLFNARSETLFEKPAWKRSAKSKRCLIPANGFFEWQKKPDGKHPQYIYPSDQKLFSFAGVYDHWTHPESKEEIESFAIITTTPNEEMNPIHDRMPVMLHTSQEDAWLSETDEQELLSDLLQPYPDTILKHYEVSTLVNTPKNQGKEILNPI